MRWLSSVVTPGPKDSCHSGHSCVVSGRWLENLSWTVSSSQFSLLRGLKEPVQWRFEWVSNSIQFYLMSPECREGGQLRETLPCHAVKLYQITLIPIRNLYILLLVHTYTYLYSHVYCNAKLVLAARESEVENQSCRTGTGAANCCTCRSVIFRMDFINFPLWYYCGTLVKIWWKYCDDIVITCQNVTSHTGHRSRSHFVFSESWPGAGLPGHHHVVLADSLSLRLTGDPGILMKKL